MKKVGIYISIIILLATANVFGQEQINIEDNETFLSTPLKQSGNNELRINIPWTIFGFPEINYERLFVDNMGLGFAGLISLENTENTGLRYILLPYYRLYFGNKKASGFFIEGNISVSGWNDTDYYSQKRKTFSSFGGGLALGVKLLARNDFIGEVYFGGGRVMGSRDLQELYPRMGICLGKRF